MHNSKTGKLQKKGKLNETIFDEEKLYRYNSEEEKFSDNKLKGQALEGKFQREESPVSVPFHVMGIISHGE